MLFAEFMNDILLFIKKIGFLIKILLHFYAKTVIMSVIGASLISERRFFMKDLKKIFPLSFRFANYVVDLIIGIMLYILVGAIDGVLIGIVVTIPIIGIVAWILGLALDVYVLAGVVIEILAFLKVVK
jgi:hypothetical protein